MIWKGLMVVTGSESPIVVVLRSEHYFTTSNFIFKDTGCFLSFLFFLLSGSMEPAFYRGDLLFLTNDQTDPIRTGEIVVFKIKDRDIPIVHRVIKVHEE